MDARPLSAPGSPQAPGSADAPRAWIAQESTLTILALAVIVVVGLVVRLPGWSGGGLYYDDAWFALPARVPLGTALHMIVTAPGYTLAQRSWIRLWPESTRWALALPLLLGVLAPIGGFLLGRVLRFSRGVSLVMAGLIAIEPSAIEYATRVKEYEADLVLAMVVLAACEVVRRRRTTRAIVAFGVVSVASMLISTSLAPVVAGSWLALIVIALLDGRRGRALVIAGVTSALVVSPVVILITERIPPRLTTFWVDNEHLVGSVTSWRRVIDSIEVAGGGLAHGVIGTPIAFPSGGYVSLSSHDRLGLIATVLIELAVFAVLSAPAVLAVIRRRADSVALRELASVLSVLIAVALFLAGQVPLGSGRTDLVIVPTIVVLAASGVSRAVARLKERSAPRTAAVAITMVAVVSSLGGAGLAWHFRSWYPTQALTSLKGKMDALGSSKTTAFVVSNRNSYTWAYDGLSPFRVHVSKSAPEGATIGFWVTFASPLVLEQASGDVSLHAPAPIPGLRSLPVSVTRLWLVGTTASTYNPSSLRLRGPAAEIAVPTGATSILVANGWHRLGVTQRAPGVVAWLFGRS